VFLVDDHPVLREGLARLIDSQPDLAVCGMAGTTAGALTALDRAQPDLVIVDIALADSNGLELIKQLRARRPELRMLVLSVHDETLYAERALRAGARGYLMKQTPTADLVAGMRAVIAGKLALSPAMHERLVYQHLQAPRTGTRSEVDLLSDRELEIYELLGRGATTRAIAARLHLSVSTVETHRAHIKRKLGIPHAIDLVRRAVEWVNRA
jgi:DNA-binding NarL/FixJ family response regulator